jgi:hypothetical protein
MGINLIVIIAIGSDIQKGSIILIRLSFCLSIGLLLLLNFLKV